MEKSLEAIAASAGVAIGPVCLWVGMETELNKTKITADGIEYEKQRYRDAVLACCQQVQQVVDAAGPEEAAIMEAHLAILEDPLLEQLVFERIEALENAEHAVYLAGEAVAEQFEATGDELTMERAADVRDEALRLREQLHGGPARPGLLLGEPCVILAKDLPPSFTAVMDREKVLGFATELGGRTSHTAIMARTMDIPAVVGVRGLMEAAEAGAVAIVDGGAGTVVLNPEAGTLATARVKRQALARRKARLAQLRRLPAETKDGAVVELMANIGLERECGYALEQGAEGVGLFRTEYLYMQGGDFPSEERQFAAYRYAARQMAGRPVVVRTLDIGGDKALPYHSYPPEQNPALGLRAIRFCLQHPGIFKTQLRAILRASAFGDLRIMVPMVVSLEELAATRELLAACMAELRAEGRDFNEQIMVGIMVETPASVMLADRLAQKADFFSIGTNDLAQYLLAADRGNEWVQPLYSHFHPAVVAGLRQVVQAGHAAGIRVTLCGEMAGDPRAVPLLLGLGLDKLSMNASALPGVKQVVRALRGQDTRALADEALAAATTAEVEALLDRFMRTHGPAEDEALA